MEFGRTMIARKVAALMIIVIALSGIVSAVTISNTLYGHATVKHTDYLQLSWRTDISSLGAAYDGVTALTDSDADASDLEVGTIYAGVWYGVGVMMVNPNTGGPDYKVIGDLTLYTDLALSEIVIKVYYGPVVGWVTEDPAPDSQSGYYSYFTTGEYTVGPSDVITAWVKFIITPRIGEDIADSWMYLSAHAVVVT